jgi:hypothetical protein
VKLARLLIFGAALLLALTAAVHSAGASMLSGSLAGERQAMLLLAWYLLAADWLVVSLLWAWCGWRADPRLAPAVYSAPSSRLRQRWGWPS